MLTPCKTVPCKSDWCINKRKCMLYETYKPSAHRDPYKWVDGKYFPLKKKNDVHDNFYSEKPIRPRNVKYPKFEFETKDTQCFYCDKEINKATRTKDHVFPRTKGGTLCDGNKVWSCQSCNSHKGNMTVVEFRDKLNKWINKKYYEKKHEYFKKILIKVEFMITKLYPNETTKTKII